MHKKRVHRKSLVRSKRRGVSRALIFSVFLTLCTLAAAASGMLFSNRIEKATAAAQDSEGISPEAMAQIEALIREKESRTAVKKKIDSQLIYQLKMDRGQAVADNVPTVETDVKVDDQGKAVIDITATVTDSLLAALQAQGAEIIAAKNNSIRALVRLDDLEAIASLDEVRFLQPKQEAMTSSVPDPVVDDKSGFRESLPLGFTERATRVQNLLTSALRGGAEGNVSGTPAPTGVGSQSSQGDVTHRANLARGVFHANGTGIKIGVLSDGVTNLAASQALGDLGPVTVLPGQAGFGDEGTAMLEIIHDVAPGAQLFFATAFNGITSFAQNIRDLRAAGCDIIVDDVFYFVETPFQDGQAPSVVSNTNGGVVIQAVNDVTASGALYFSSAGNEGNLNDGTAGVWEGNFVDGGPAGSPVTTVGSLHNFGGQNFNVLTVPSAPINLYWSDPLGNSSNDYDLFLLDPAGTSVVASSINIQSGTQDPYEQINTAGTGFRIVIVKKTGVADRFLHLNTNRGALSIATAGQTHGHNSAANAFGCAATPAATAFGPAPSPTGPFPNPFNSSNTVELFSSDGPRRIFYRDDGTAITPGNFSATGGLLRQKPDITAADGVSTAAPGFGTFFGTSAAAPHAAAIAGLLKSANPSFTPAQIRMALTGSAIDIEAPGVDRDSGAGIVDAVKALQAIGVPTPTTTVSATGPVQYSDVVTLSSTTIPQVNPAPTLTGSVEFFVNNVSVGAAPVNSGGVATINTRILLAAGSYPLRAVFTSSNPDISNSMGTSMLMIMKEDAVVTPSASNPALVKVIYHTGST